mgnify:FL=1
MDMMQTLSQELSVPRGQIESAVRLMDEGNTIPFIARYRKEATGGLDDTVLRNLSERLSYLRNLEKRRQEVFALVEESGKLEGRELEQLRAALEKAQMLSEIEDLYRPYRPKRRTRASVARERGLEGLAHFLKEQRPGGDLKREAAKYVDPDKEVPDTAVAIAGAGDILAEELSDSARLRGQLRDYLQINAQISTTMGTKENEIYQMYSEYSESIRKIPSHRVLAIDRGEREEALKVNVEADHEHCVQLVERELVRKNSPFAKELQAVCADSFERLIFPSLTRELRAELTERACKQAIGVFSENLKNLLMQPPVKGAVTMGFDPAYRTGCKIAVVDANGKVLETTVVYPTPPQSKTGEARKVLGGLIRRYGVTVIAIGNGTASKESEIFVAELLGELNPTLTNKVSYMVVSEAGASVYSASKLGAEEFPQFDVSLRSAVSIARRLQDPLAELVKIDPKAIGVGQYQHDMPPKQLDEALGGVVEDCVNRVGVDLNTASGSLLSYVAGVNQAVAKNIVAYREENGSFVSRSQLMKVPKLGKKAYEQCAGFLRVPESGNPLDHTGVHPESYAAAQKLLTLCGYRLEEVLSDEIAALPKRVAALGSTGEVAARIGVGEPTLRDMVAELVKPGRDPRDELPKPLLRTDVMELSDLKPGMVLTGTVRNVTDFGAFVDIAVHEDGLVHISQICNRYIRHPSEVLKVGDIVRVKVLDVDLKRKRISLTMKDLDGGEKR